MTPTGTVEATDTVGTGHGSESTAVFTRKPTHGEVVFAIREEALAKGESCDYDTAQRVYGLLYRAVKNIRKWEYKNDFHLSDDEIARTHSVLDAIMPDEAIVPAAGSAHDLVHRHFLQGDEFALIHTKAGPQLQYCAVAIELRSI